MNDLVWTAPCGCTVTFFACCRYVSSCFAPCPACTERDSVTHRAAIRDQGKGLAKPEPEEETQR